MWPPVLFALSGAPNRIKIHLLLTRFGAWSVRFFELFCGIIFTVVVDPKY